MNKKISRFLLLLLFLAPHSVWATSSNCERAYDLAKQDCMKEKHRAGTSVWGFVSGETERTGPISQSLTECVKQGLPKAREAVGAKGCEDKPVPSTNQRIRMSSWQLYTGEASDKRPPISIFLGCKTAASYAQRVCKPHSINLKIIRSSSGGSCGKRELSELKCDWK